MPKGRLVAIYLTSSPGAPLEARDSASAVAGIGLDGDRYANRTGTFAKPNPSKPDHVTLIESEAIEAALRDYQLDITAAMTRRNLVTRGVPLNHLVGQTFRVGGVTIRGVELCEPCGHLERLTCAGIKKALIHRGGLRAEIVEGGAIQVGDEVTWDTPIV